MKYRANQVDEAEFDDCEYTIQPSKIVDFQINYNDNCFTAIMRAIDRRDLIDTYRGSLHIFMIAYREKIIEMADELHLFGNDIADTFGDMGTYNKPLQRGHVLVLNNKVAYGNPFKGKYTQQYGVITEDFEVRANGHMMLCLDPGKNLFLHMKSHDCGGLILSVHEVDLTKYKKTKHFILDGGVIDRLGR